MKKFIASVCSLMFVFTASTISASTSIDEVKAAPITIRHGSGNGSQITRPRTPAFIPIIGLYDNGRVVLDFTENIGTLCISVVNQSTGEMVIDYCDSADDHFEIEISASKGEYLLMIQTDNGTTYYGDFVL